MNIEEIKDFVYEVRTFGITSNDTKFVQITEYLLSELEKEKEKNKNAYRKANNYLYFNDSADYEIALWEVIRKLRPDLAEKWDNGEDVDLEYIEEE